MQKLQICDLRVRCDRASFLQSLVWGLRRIKWLSSYIGCLHGCVLVLSIIFTLIYTLLIRISPVVRDGFRITFLLSPICSAPEALSLSILHIRRPAPSHVGIFTHSSSARHEESTILCSGEGRVSPHGVFTPAHQTQLYKVGLVHSVPFYHSLGHSHLY